MRLSHAEGAGDDACKHRVSILLRSGSQACLQSPPRVCQHVDSSLRSSCLLIEQMVEISTVNPLPSLISHRNRYEELQSIGDAGGASRRVQRVRYRARCRLNGFPIAACAGAVIAPQVPHGFEVRRGIRLSWKATASAPRTTPARLRATASPGSCSRRRPRCSATLKRRSPLTSPAPTRMREATIQGSWRRKAWFA
jgi:hypothetical protein